MFIHIKSVPKSNEYHFSKIVGYLNPSVSFSAAVPPLPPPPPSPPPLSQKITCCCFTALRRTDNYCRAP